MLAILLATAFAAPPADVVKRQERVAYETMLVHKALEADAFFAGAPCPNARVRDVATQEVRISGHDDQRVLHEKLEVAGCGRNSNQNIYVVRGGGSPPWRMANTMPGESRADMTVQGAVWSAAVTQAHVDLPGDCRGQRLGDIYVAARPGHVTLRAANEATPPDRTGWFSVALPAELGTQKANLDVSQAWVEIWPMALCGQDRTLAVVFIPLRDHAHDVYGFVPVWRSVQAFGLTALPQPAPEADQTSGETARRPASPNPAS